MEEIRNTDLLNEKPEKRISPGHRYADRIKLGLKLDNLE